MAETEKLEVTREQLVNMGKAIAQDVVNKLHRYAITYQPPPSIPAGLHESMGEELTAANWYRQRAEDAREQGDETTASLYEHVALEEEGHYREFSQREESIVEGGR